MGVKKKILVIEDEENICELFHDFLEREGHEPVIARCGEDALDRAGDSQWDLVFLDLSLPRLNGWDVIVRLKKIQPDIKVVITTGFNCEEIKAQGDRHGVVDYLQKPFLLDDIAAILARYG